MKPTLAGVLTCLLVTSLLAPIAIGSAVAQEETETQPTCQTEVAHDAFLTDELVQEFNETGSTSDIQQNTRITIEETSSFYRVRGENPNSYCVHVTVEVDEKILPPTNLGTVASNNEIAKATWEDVMNFDRQEVHTRIEFVMPPNSTVLFAPSKPTVLLPAWRDEKKHKAEGIIGSIAARFDDSQLEKRTYTFSANGSPSVTVPLTNESTDQRITEWVAVYRTDPDEPWDPVDKDTEDPVFYQVVEDGDKVRFYFNNPDAKVEFTANPTLTDKGQWEIRSFRRSLYDLSDVWPFGVLAPGLTGGGTW